MTVFVDGDVCVDRVVFVYDVQCIVVDDGVDVVAFRVIGVFTCFAIVVIVSVVVVVIVCVCCTVVLVMCFALVYVLLLLVLCVVYIYCADVVRVIAVD